MTSVESLANEFSLIKEASEYVVTLTQSDQALPFTNQENKNRFEKT